MPNLSYLKALRRNDRSEVLSSILLSEEHVARIGAIDAYFWALRRLKLLDVGSN